MFDYYSKNKVKDFQVRHLQLQKEGVDDELAQHWLP